MHAASETCRGDDDETAYIRTSDERDHPDTEELLVRQPPVEVLPAVVGTAGAALVVNLRLLARQQWRLRRRRTSDDALPLLLHWQRTIQAQCTPGPYSYWLARHGAHHHSSMRSCRPARRGSEQREADRVNAARKKRWIGGGGGGGWVTCMVWSGSGLQSADNEWILL